MSQTTKQQPQSAEADIAMSMLAITRKGLANLGHISLDQLSAPLTPSTIDYTEKGAPKPYRGIG